MPAPKPLTLEDLNAELTRVKIVAIGEKLYLRATLPKKDGTPGKQQYRVKTELSHNQDGLRIARERAKRLESDLNLERFQWSDWYDIPEDGGIYVADALEKLTKWYWETRKKTIGREKAFKENYLRFLGLPAKAVLTTDLIRSHLVDNYEADSFYRKRAHLALGLLAKSNEIPLPSDWKYLKGKYKPKNDWYIPTEEEIERIWRSIKNPGWRWAFGVLATYGLRPHELFHLDISNFPQLRILEETKTGEHIAYPILKRWFYDFNLAEYRFPNISTENKCNQDLGEKISAKFWDMKLGFTPMSLRHAYALRCARLKIDSLVVCEWMGHSPDVHKRYYFKHIHKRAMQEIYDSIDDDR
ncbi:hypothetical protein V0288_11105 [Pannus brasiliensis CCIBt3594]|uniref:Tyr recombinase domain-containing protein n=1 Tax=Pannus brasiliensis CCIBt3594 TaxID=1427578 RepID=A0AAW9QTQ5_9CHRO